MENDIKGSMRLIAFCAKQTVIKELRAEGEKAMAGSGSQEEGSE